MEQIDKWALEVGRTYLNVLVRPVYRVTIISDLTILRPQVLMAELEKDENRYQFMVSSNRRSVQISVLPLKNGELDWDARFSYQKTFNKIIPDKIRKSALILAKKLNMRNIMDIMKN